MRIEPQLSNAIGIVSPPMAFRMILYLFLFATTAYPTRRSTVPRWVNAEDVYLRLLAVTLLCGSSRRANKLIDSEVRALLYRACDLLPKVVHWESPL